MQQPKRRAHKPTQYHFRFCMPSQHDPRPGDEDGKAEEYKAQPKQLWQQECAEIGGHYGVQGNFFQ